MIDLAMPMLLKGFPACAHAKLSMRCVCALEHPSERYVYCGLRPVRWAISCDKKEQKVRTVHFRNAVLLVR